MVGGGGGGGTEEKFLIALRFSETVVKRQPDAKATELKRRLNVTSKHIIFNIIFRCDTESPKRWQFDA